MLLLLTLLLLLFWTNLSVKSIKNKKNKYLILSSFIPFLFFFFWPYHMACGILVPWTGINLRPMSVRAWSPNHWTARKAPTYSFSNVLSFFLLIQVSKLYYCFSSFWRTYFNISWKADLLATNPLNFSLCENVFISPSHLKDNSLDTEF